MLYIKPFLFLKQCLSFIITRALLNCKSIIDVQRHKVEFLLSKRRLINTNTVFDWIISFWLFFFIQSSIIFLALLLTYLNHILHSLLSQKRCIDNALQFTISYSAKILKFLILNFIWDSLMKVFLFMILIKNFAYI